MRATLFWAKSRLYGKSNTRGTESGNIDDPNVPDARSKKFAEIMGARLKTLQRGGHISTDYVVRKYWAEIKKFFESA